MFRILKVFREVKGTLDNRILGTGGGNKLRHVILVIIESGMALFSIQLARGVASIVPLETVGGEEVFNFIIGIHNMLTVITPLVIATPYFTDHMGLVRE